MEGAWETSKIEMQ